MKFDPHISAAFKKELADWRLWWARSGVVAAAVVAGLTVVAFTWLTELASTAFFNLRTAWWWAPLLWTPINAAAVVWLTRRFAAGAGGSGIPQVMASLAPEVTETSRDLFVSVRLTIGKFLLTAWALLGGLSLGREGPSVQIAAGVTRSVRRWLPKGIAISEHGLIVAGGAAGIAAAFNTPLAGVMFAIEELSRNPEQRKSGLVIACIVLAGLIAVSFHGNSTYFGILHITSLSLKLLGPGLLVTVLSGLAGGLFARLLIQSFSGQARDRFSRFKQRSPVRFAVACGLAVAVIGVVTGGATFGSGYLYTRQMVEGASTLPAVYVLFKFISTWLTSWAGVPAGIFAPSLAIGAALGNDVAMLTHVVDAPVLIALGMVGFLAAATQAPLTSFIIVMEMVDGHALVLSLMACALVASGLSRILSRPLYPSLADMQLKRLPPADPTATNAPPLAAAVEGTH